MANNEKRNAIIYINGVEVNRTLDSIQKHASQLRNELKHLTYGSDAYNKKVKELQAANSIISKHKDNVSGINRIWNDMKSQIAGTGAVLMAFLGGQAIVNGFRNMIQRLGALDDQLADIGKTTGLSRTELQKLDKDLRGISTRSTRTELLDLAKEAGKLGYNSVADIKRFVEQADQINVALGEDLGEDAIIMIGKLSNIFKTEMKNIGSALNEVAAEGIASEGWQVDYLNRLAGISNTAKLSLPDMLGYGAALESMGQTSEVAGTSLSQFFTMFISKSEELGKIAGFAKGELTALLNDQGTNAAFIAFLEKLKEGSSSTADLIQKLDAMGIDGQRASNILLVLANNTDEVTRQQKIANDAFAEGTSITEEFTKKQETFGAVYARFQKWLAGVFLNNAIANGVRNLVTGFTNLVTPIKTVNDQLQEERNRLNVLVLTIANHNTSQHTRKAAIEELKSTYPDFIKLVDIETASTEELYEALNKVNQEYAKQIVIQRKGQEAADQAQKQADALEKVINAEMKFAQAAVKIKDASGIIQEANESNAEFIQRVGYIAWDKSAKTVTKTMLDLRKAHQELNGAYTELYVSQGNLKNETDKYNDLLAQQDALKKKLLGDPKPEVPIDPGKPNADGSTPLTSLEDYNNKLKDTKDILKEIDEREELRQQIFLALADEETKALAELDKFWEELITGAMEYGWATDEMYKKWEEQARLLSEKVKLEAAAAKALFHGAAGGGDKPNEAAAKAAEEQRNHIEKELELTMSLRHEREQYVEAMFMTAAAAVSGAENEKAAIKGVINAIRDAIKQRIVEAIAISIARALSSFPFPLNLIIGAAAGAGTAALFDKFVPQAADGGYYTDVVGRQTGMGYRAKVDQRFMGGYATQPMLVGEHAAEYTVPSYLMQNPYAVQMVDSLERMRTGQGNDMPAASPGFDMRAIYDLIEFMRAQNGKPTYAILPDQTVMRFSERQLELEPISKRAKR